MSQDIEQSNSKVIWKVINSPFFLWFLSSIVIGLITFGYSSYISYQTRSNDNHLTIQKLDLEMKSRLRFFANKVKAESYTTLSDGFSATNLAEAMLSLEVPEIQKFPIHIFPEYKQRNLRSLVWELHMRVPMDEKSQLAIALEALFDLRRIYEKQLLLEEKPIKLEQLVGQTRKMLGVERKDKSSKKLNWFDMASIYANTVDEMFPNTVQSVFILFFQSKMKPKFRPLDIERWGKPFSKEWGSDFYIKHTDTKTQVGNMRRLGDAD